MAKYAIVVNDMVDNLIVIAPAAVASYIEATGAELVEASELRLGIGDLRVGENWTRNVDGEQVRLPIADIDEVEQLLIELEEAVGND